MRSTIPYDSAAQWGVSVSILYINVGSMIQEPGEKRHIIIDDRYVERSLTGRVELIYQSRILLNRSFHFRYFPKLLL